MSTNFFDIVVPAVETPSPPRNRELAERLKAPRRSPKKEEVFDKCQEAEQRREQMIQQRKKRLREHFDHLTEVRQKKRNKEQQETETLRRLVNCHRSSQITAAAAKAEPFPTFFEKVNSKENMQLTKDVLNVFANQHFKLVVEHRRFEEGTTIPLTCKPFVFAPKTFLSAFLCITDQFLNKEKHEEQYLHDLATKLISTFEEQLELVDAGKNDTEEFNTRLNQFATMWNEFVPTFNNWRNGDMQAMVKHSVSTYCELEQARRAIISTPSNRPEEKTALLEGIDDRLEGIKQLIEKTGGAKGIQQLNEELETLLPLEEPASPTSPISPAGFDDPTTSSSSSSSSTTPQNNSASQEAIKDLMEKRRMAQLAHNAALPFHPEAQNLGAKPLTPEPKQMYTNCPSLPQQFFASLSGADKAIPSPPSVSTEPTANTTTTTTNTENQPKATITIADIVAQAEKAFWDVLKIELSENPPNYGRLPAIMEEIRTMLIGLIPNRTDFHQEINESLDWELFEHDMTVQSLQNFANYVVNKIVELGEPSAQEQILSEYQTIMQEVAQADNIVAQLPTVLQFLYKKIKRLQQAVHEWRMKLVQPRLAQDVVKYEQEWYAAEKALNGFPLTKTLNWLKSTTSDWLMQNWEQIDKNRNEVYTKAINLGVLSLLEKHEMLSPKDLPETLCLDLKNLIHMQQSLQYYTLIQSFAAIVNLVLSAHATPKTSLSPTELQTFKAEMGKVLNDPTLTLDALGPRLVAVVVTLLSARQQPIQLADQVQGILCKMAAKTADSNDAVYKAQHTVVRSEMRAALLGEENKRAPTPELQTTIQQLKRLCAHSVTVFGEQYNELLQTIVNTADEL